MSDCIGDDCIGDGAWPGLPPTEDPVAVAADEDPLAVDEG